MSHWFKGILFLFMTSTAWAAVPALVLLDANKTTSTAKNAKYLEDRARGISFEEVRQLGDDKFSPQSTLKTLNEGSAYWVRVKLKHGLADDTVFVVTAYWWDYIDTYVVRAGGKLETMRQR